MRALGPGADVAGSLHAPAGEHGDRLARQPPAGHRPVDEDLRALGPALRMREDVETRHRRRDGHEVGLKTHTVFLSLAASPVVIPRLEDDEVIAVDEYAT